MPDDLRRSLSNVAQDLWGVRKAPAPHSAAPCTTPDFPPFEQLWSAVDETVDWTEILTHAAPTDGLTAPESWRMYRRYAQRVLDGDPQAYLAVLTAVDPLKDLTPWAEKLEVICSDADTLRVLFTAIPTLSQREGQRYWAGMSLRIARDLLALLPALQVDVTVLSSDASCMTVRFARAELQKVRFSFIDPVDFALQCGADFPCDR